MSSLYDFKKSFKEGVTILILFFLHICLFSPSLLALEVPSKWGQISEKFEGTNGQTLVLIQEAHVDYGAQKAIVEILKTLIQKDSLRLILVEGGWEDMGLTYLRNYGSPQGRLEVTERYLREGKISAEEYLDIVSDLDFSIWGIEDPKLYAENMQVFLKFHEDQEKALEEISRVQSELGPLKEKIYSPTFQEFEKKKQSFEEKKISLLDYLHYMSGQTDPKLLNESVHLKKLLSLTQGEGGIDPEKAEWEKQALINALSKKLTKPELDNLRLLQERKSLQEELEFFYSLHAFYQKYRQKLGTLSLEHLKRYTQALEEVSQIKPREIFNEVDRLEKALAEKLLTTPEQKDLYHLQSTLETLRKLFELKLSPEEFDPMEKNPSDFKLSQWSQKFSLSNLESLEIFISPAKSFYLSAIRREQALIDNAVKKMKEKKDPLTAMIVGGFHSEALMQALKDRGYSLVVVSPRFTPADPKTQDQHYFEIMKYKWGTAKEAALNPTQQGGITNHVAKN